jgi:hypothetical protein
VVVRQKTPGSGQPHFYIMTEEHAHSDAAPASTPDPQPAAAKPAPPKDRKIIIRMWPKTPVLYPMALVALICCLVAHFAGSSDLSNYPLGTNDPVAEESGAPGNADAPAEEAPTEGTSANPQASTGQATVLVAQAPAPDTPQADDAEKELEKKRVDRTLAVIFLLTLFFSLFAICVDLDVRWAIIYASALVILALLLWILDITVGFFPMVTPILDHITPMANAQFFLGVFLVWFFLMCVSFFITRFHYVKVEASEVMVVGGMLERQQRYDTMRMRYTKEIHDVMEYYLPFVRSGRLIFSFPEQNEAVIIDNVINIKKVTRQLDEIVGSGGHTH